MYNELLKNVMNLGIITEDDVRRLTAIELMMLIIERSNGLLNYVENIDEKLINLLENVDKVTIDELNKWVEDGTFDRLINEKALTTVNHRIDETNEVLMHKANKDEIFSMANMGQDIREAMTGGSVAVVGSYSVGQQNIVDGSVGPSKLDKYTNLINKDNVELNKVISPSSFIVSDLQGYALTDFIPIQQGKYTINFASHDTVFIYNTSKEGQSSVTTSTAPHTFEVTSDGYIRLVIKQVDLNNAMLVHGETVPSTYIPYGYISWLSVGEENLSSETIGKIDDNEESIKRIENKFRYLNLFDGSTVTEGVMLNYPSDNLTANDNFCVSDFIRVTEGNYTLNIANYDTVFMYDKNKKLTNKVSLSGWGIVVNTINIPSGISFVRLSVLKAYKNQIMLAKGNSLSPTYVSYGKYAMDNLVVDTENNILSGKTALFTGDSICYGAGSTGGYARYIGENNNMNVINYGVSGTRVAVSDVENAIVTRIATMQDNADYICLEGGVNDAWSGKVPLGVISDGFNGELDETTFTGAFESLLKQSLLKWKEAKIFYLIPHKMMGVNEYLDRAKELCEKWGVPCLDLRLMTGFFAYDDEMKQTYTANGDGVHPNERGYKVFYVDKITAFMKTL